jgi:hypothetical protein
MENTKRAKYTDLYRVTKFGSWFCVCTASSYNLLNSWGGCLVQTCFGSFGGWPIMMRLEILFHFPIEPYISFSEVRPLNLRFNLPNHPTLNVWLSGSCAGA